jgi:catechol 2,3-dioxygenase-like lactoylglutathione lyase family enzyme
VTKAHHTAICTTEVDDSLRFWRDGLGFEVTMDHEFEGDWPALFEAPSNRLRSIFLGDPRDPSAGTVELVDLGALPAGAPVGGPTTGFFLMSVYVDVDEALARLAELGLGGEPRRIGVRGVSMAVVRDPNGVRVELIGVPA